MTAQLDPPRADAGQTRSPYRGLMPYTEEDAEYFFGREGDVLLIANNARANRFGLLYGPSGVGKSSVLRAGVVRHIREENLLRMERFGDLETVVAYLKEWREDPYAALAAELGRALGEATGTAVEIPPRDLVAATVALCEANDVDLVLILDQFEEFFLYHKGDVARFAGVLAMLTAPATTVNVLVAIREDALARLDEFEGIVPGVFDNTLRLEHLDEHAARAAMIEPLRRYNMLVPEGQQREIEPALVDGLVHQVQAGRVKVDSLVESTADAPRSPREHGDVVRVEAAFLQLVLTRLWDEENSRESAVLRLSTLTDLGGAQEIVRQHLDRVMHGFTDDDLVVLADAFGHLVTPSGSKIAHRASDLADFSGHAEHMVEALLERLCRGDQRILREVPAPMDRPGAPPSYEIFHDVLALAVLDWRRRFLAEAESQRQQGELMAEAERAERETRETKRRLRRARLAVSGLALLLVACLVLTALAVISQRRANDAAERAARSRTLDRVNRLLETDPSAALALAASRWDSDAENRSYEDSFRRALDAADTDLVLKADSPVVTAFFVDDDLVTVTENGLVRRWDGQLGEYYRVDEVPLWEVDATEARLERVVAAVPAGGHGFVILRTDAGLVYWVDLDSRRWDALEVDLDENGAISASSTGDGDLVAVWNHEGVAALWDVAERRFIQMDGMPTRIHSATVDSSGAYVAIVTQKQRIQVWSVQLRKRVKSAPLAFSEGDQAPAYGTVVFAEQGQDLRIAAIGDHSEIFTWGSRRQDPLEPLDLTMREVFDYADLAGERLAVAGDKQVWIYKDGEQKQATTPMNDVATQVEVNPDNPTLYALGTRDGEVELHELGPSPYPLWRFRGHRGVISSVDFSADGQHLVTASRDGTVRVWRLPARAVHRRSSNWMVEAQFNSEGDVVLGMNAHGVPVRAGPGRQVDEGSVSVAGQLLGMAAAPDGSAAVSADRPCSPVPALHTFDGERPPKLEEPELGTACVTSVAWSPAEDRPLIVAGTDSGDLVAWDATTREIVHNEDLADSSAEVGEVAVSGDGSTVAAAFGRGVDGWIRLFDTTTWEEVAEWPARDVGSLDISREGDYVATSGNDEHTVHLWEVAAGPPATVLRQAQGTLAQVALSPEEEASRLAVTTSEGLVYVWDRRSTNLLAVLRRHAGAANDVAFHPTDIDRLLSAGDDGDLVSYRCELCSLGAEDLDEAADERMAQVVDLRE